MAQTTLAIGEWADLFPFRAGLSVAQSPTTVYYSTELGIVGFDKEERTHTTITTVEGLSQAKEAKLIYHNRAEVLVAVYDNGVIDIIDEDGVFTMKDIANFSNIPIDKNANSLYEVLGSNAILLSADYGISSIDVVNKKVLWTCFTVGNPVNAAVEWRGDYYAATDDGLFKVDRNNIVENFDAWQTIDSTDGFVNDIGLEALTVFDNWLVTGHEEDLYAFIDDKWSKIHSEPGFEIRALRGGRQYCLASYFCPNSCDSKVLAFNGNLDSTVNKPGCVNRVFEALEDQYGWIWYAELYDNFRLAAGNGASCQGLKINGPFSKNVSDIAIGFDEVVVASGGIIDNFSYSYKNDGFFVLSKEGKWTNHNLFNTDELRERDLKNFHRIAIHPGTGDQYHATYWGGVVVYHRDGTYSFYNEENSALRRKDKGDARERCTDVTFDDDNNLWVTTFLAPENGLSVLTHDGQWKGFNPKDFGNGPNQVAIDQNGYKWITLLGDPSKGVYVFYEGEDIDSPADDQHYVFSRNNSELPSNNAICVTVDLDGDVWVGTDQGAVVFECGTNIFEGQCEGNRRKVEQDSILGLLLQTEEVRCIAVDGANRKWFGTRNGIYVQSPSGEEQVFEINEENSPLPDNLIYDIAIDPKDGTAYIGTNRGVMAYRSDAVEGGKTHASEVVAYPNPVRPGYQGPIAVKGLPRDAEVRITDIDGELIYQTDALGGQAIWDGTDYNGRKAQSGVYLVFSTSQGGDFEKPEALVTKILIMN